MYPAFTATFVYGCVLVRGWCLAERTYSRIERTVHFLTYGKPVCTLRGK